MKTLLALLLTALVAQGELKIIAYNIWNGADAKKEKNLARWVKTQDPDVIALQELVGINAERLQKMAASWNHPHSAILKEDGYPVGITAKNPIQVMDRIRKDLWHGCLHVKIDGIEYFVVHLHPGNVNHRMQEAAVISKRIKLSLDAKRPVIALGDFNTHSRLDRDWFDQQTELINSRKDSANMRGNRWDYQVIDHFLNLGLVDLNHKHAPGDLARGTFPTQVFDSSKTEAKRLRRCERIDYIFASPDLAKTSISSQTIYGHPVDKDLSDHYPVVATIQLLPQTNKPKQ